MIHKSRNILYTCLLVNSQYAEYGNNKNRYSCVQPLTRGSRECINYIFIHTMGWLTYLNNRPPSVNYPIVLINNPDNRLARLTSQAKLSDNGFDNFPMKESISNSTLWWCYECFLRMTACNLQSISTMCLTDYSAATLSDMRITSLAFVRSVMCI